MAYEDKKAGLQTGGLKPVLQLKDANIPHQASSSMLIPDRNGEPAESGLERK
jgi:hypothetical protein